MEMLPQRLFWYGFSALLVLIGIGLTFMTFVLHRDEERWWMGPIFIGAGMLTALMVFVIHRTVTSAHSSRALILSQGIHGRATVTAVKKLRSGETDRQNLLITMTVEVPERPPYEATERKLYHYTRIDTLQPGMVVPVRVHPSDPAQVLIPTDEYNFLVD